MRIKPLTKGAPLPTKIEVIATASLDLDVDFGTQYVNNSIYYILIN